MNDSYNDDRDTILIDYYVGAYGPTIRIDVVTENNLHKIRNLFVNFVKSPNYEIDLIKIENIKAIGIKSLLLKSIPANQKKEKKLQLVRNTENDPQFLWQMSSNNWENAVCLIQALLDDINHPGHQYLTREEIDDAVIEFCFLERKEFIR